MVVVAPDCDVTRKPIDEAVAKIGSITWSKSIMDGNMIVGKFQKVISKKWHRWEGNEEGKVVERAKREEGLAFVQGMYSPSLPCKVYASRSF